VRLPGAQAACFCPTRLRVLFGKFTERVDRYKPSASGTDGSDAAGIKKLLHECAADSKFASRFLNTDKKCLPGPVRVRQEPSALVS